MKKTFCVPILVMIIFFNYSTLLLGQKADQDKVVRQNIVWVSPIDSDDKIKGYIGEINDEYLTVINKNGVLLTKLPYSRIEKIKIRKIGNITAGGILAGTFGFLIGSVAVKIFNSSQYSNVTA